MQSLSAGAIAAERSAMGDLSPAPTIAASQSLRVYVTEAQPDPSNVRSAELAIVSLSEKLILERWRMVHKKYPESRGAVLAAVAGLEKRVDQLLRSVSGGTQTFDPERLTKLKESLDATVADFRLRLKTTFFQ